MLSDKLITSIRSTPYYAGRTEYNNLTDIQSLPIITKDIVVVQQNAFFSNLYEDSPYLTMSTSGSSGYPLEILWNHLDYYNSLLDVWKIRKSFGVLPSDRYVSTHIIFKRNTSILTNKAVLQKNNLSLSKGYFDEASLKYYYSLLVEFQPKWMLVAPSFIYGFIQFLNKYELRLPGSIKLVELTGEYCPNETFIAMQDEYPNIIWRSLYGMQEFNVIAYGDINGLEILNSNVFLEISGTDNESSSQNDGPIIITGLKNHLMPLVRYKSEDFGYIDDNRKLHITCARSNDKIQVGENTYDGSIFFDIITKINAIIHNKIIQFQVVLESNILYFNLKLSTSHDKGQLEQLVQRTMYNNYGIEYKAIVNIIGNILPIPNTNKIKYFVNKDI